MMRTFQLVTSSLAALFLLALAGAGAAGAASLNPIQVENALPGTSSWFVAAPKQSQIDGYFGATSYLPGDVATLYVDSHRKPFSYTIYRMGYYQGLGGREIVHGAVATNAAQPHSHVVGDINRGQKLLLTRWKPSAQIPLGQDWVSGFYLVKLTAASGAESYANFVLRSPDPAPIVVVLATNTWQAYNSWGGLSLYRDYRTRRPIKSQLKVAHRVSFLRPYGFRSTDDQTDDTEGSGASGAGLFFVFDRPLVTWAEANGYAVSYATDDDLRRADEAGPSTKLVVFSGHSEYHSLAERTEVLRLPQVGVSEAFLGGNDFIWQARFDGENVMSVWRWPEIDPCKDPSLVTTKWKLLGLPQADVTGTMETHGTPDGQQVALATSSWPWAGAGLTDGAGLGMLQSGEYDGIRAASNDADHLLVLSRTSFTPDPAGADGGAVTQNMTLWQRTPDAFVFSAGETSFNWYLSYPSYPAGTSASWVDPRYPSASQVSAPFQTLVGNLIARATGNG